MNPHIIIEKRPSDWLLTTFAVLFEAAVFFCMGYFAYPLIQGWLK